MVNDFEYKTYVRKEKYKSYVFKDKHYLFINNRTHDCR